jgi:hypothetical protein
MILKRQILNRLPYVVLFLMTFHFSYAQFSDNFSDGEFSASPAWTGSTIDFVVNGSQQLQLTNSLAQAGTSYLSTPYAAASINNYEWQVYVKQTFSSSGSNFGRVYLVSDQADLTGSLNGYYLQFGEAGSLDAVELFKQAGSTHTSVCRATNSAIANSFALRVKVLRDDTGLWRLFIDYSGGTTFTQEASATDATYTTSSFLGIECVYTASNFNKFFYDDFYMGPEILDTDPPQIVSATVTSATQLDVLFNEKLEATTAQLASNYTVSNSVGNPASAILQADEKTVKLTFVNAFPNATTSTLTVTDVKDLQDNGIVSATQDFFFFQAVPAVGKDIIITEIFADPSPAVGLPEAEFIELYNRSNKVFDLQNWKLSDGSSTGILPTHYLLPGEYVILTPTASASLFTSFGTTLGVTNFPTLNNSGDALTLKDNSNVEIDYVHYLDTWYADEDKEQGGYSLELIDPANPCGEEKNWIASDATNGGTPGTQNSVFANKPDLTGPKLISAIPISATQLVVRFDEKLSNELPAITDFTITPENLVTTVSFIDASLGSLKLYLNSSLQSGVTYLITVKNIHDCNGNLVSVNFNDTFFGLPEQAMESDIVINEILFNPRPTGIDFVEVYNNSSKFINLKKWAIANIENEVVINSRMITPNDFLVSPGQYIAFSENSNLLKGEYISAIEANLFQVADLPSFNDTEGSVALVDSLNNIIDFFTYTDDLHTPFLKDDEGVSLERISFSEPTNSKSNWKSASTTSGYATPGYMNSNSRVDAAQGKIVISPEVFEPLSGVNDFTQIQYNFSNGGLVANIKILDALGREIKQIANNVTLGTSGFFRWDGDTNEGTKARVGY